MPRPINYWLARILPLQEITTNSNKHPYVIQGPRAVQGSEIGGFKQDSEVSSALRTGPSPATQA